MVCRLRKVSHVGRNFSCAVIMRSTMARRSLAALFVFALFGSQMTPAQSTPDTTQAHCAAAKAAAGTDLVNLYMRFAAICEAAVQPAQGGAAAGAPGAAGGRSGGGAAAGPRPAPARDTWFHEPAKVFDNLYFI